MFDRLVGNVRVSATLLRMLSQGRVPGALLFAGEEGVGKREFAIEVAKALNCRQPRGVEACDVCSSCKRIPQFAPSPSDPDEKRRFIAWSGHPDVALVRRESTVITVNQSRAVERESNFRPLEGRARVFIIEEADRLNEQASNALLKTLEEIAPTSHLILISSRPASLLPTIRSRSQVIRFAPLQAAEIESYLVREKKRAGDEARLVARLAGGRLGRALNLNLDAYREGRETMIGVVESLAARPPDRARLLRVAEEMTDAKHKDDYNPQLDTLSTLLHDAWLLSVDSRAEIVNGDLRERLARLASNVDNRRATRWLELIDELRSRLLVNVNKRIATDDLFLSMAAAAKP